jgi:SAM-dependent methyltransferase
MSEIEKILARFPKQRPPLPAAQQKIYEQEYLANREGKNLASSLAQKLEAWMHRKVAQNVVGSRFLEVGAGTLNHAPYFEGRKIEYYDAVEPAKFLYQDSVFKPRIRNFYGDISQCDSQYDSIFSIAALEHVTNLPEVLAKMGKLLADGGVCVNAIPCEGGFLWGLSWRLSTGLSYKLRTGFSYKTLMRHEHINGHDEIIALHKHFFEKVRLVYFPIWGKHFSLYCCIVASQPKIK